jgi:ArsR family transcriptional regulator, arsenate/arsenite/antimonite-responsive transcriptional repressor
MRASAETVTSRGTAACFLGIRLGGHRFIGWRSAPKRRIESAICTCVETTPLTATQSARPFQHSLVHGGRKNSKLSVKSNAAGQNVGHSAIIQTGDLVAQSARHTSRTNSLTETCVPYISIGMEKSAVLSALTALSQETRLDIFRLLVQAGANGLPAGQIGEQLGLPSATLAFHLKELKNARLATFTRNGRSLIYAAEYSTMNALLFYLTENCCGRPSSAFVPEFPPEIVAQPTTPLKRRS